MAKDENVTRRAFFPPRLGQWLGPLLVAGGAAAVLGIGVAVSGIVDLSANIPHPEGWAGTLHAVFNRSVDAHSGDVMVPADLRTMPIAKGAMIFDAVCANCHGVPGRGQSLVALSMRPQPQFLQKVIPELTDKELFWIVKHGVKYSAMPSFPTQQRDDEIWSIVAFLRAVPKMDGAGYRALTGPVAVERAAAATPAPDAAVVPAGFRGENNAAVPALGFGGQRLAADPAETCAACHGADGSTPRSGGIPVLGLLDADTIRAALNDYANGRRKSGFMQPIAVQLSPAQIDALAQRFGNHRPVARAATPAPADPGLLARGAAIAGQGRATQPVTACQQCHDINRATRKFYPAIAGQDWRYLRDQLRLYRDGIRHHQSSVRPMQHEAERLTDADIDAVAAWYAAQPPQAPEPVATAAVAKPQPPARKDHDGN